MFSPTQTSLLEAVTGDTPPPVYTSLWALFVPKTVKGASLLPLPSETPSPAPNQLLDRFHTANRS